jgi:hypothetical protein
LLLWSLGKLTTSLKRFILLQDWGKDDPINGNGTVAQNAQWINDYYLNKPGARTGNLYNPSFTNLFDTPQSRA